MEKWTLREWVLIKFMHQASEVELCIGSVEGGRRER